MKQAVAFLFLILLSCQVLMAGNWERKHLTDEFGDPDYSKPVYELQVNPQGGYGASVTFSYIQGVFIVDFIDAHVILDDIRSIKAKSANGTIYDIPFEQISHEPAQYGIPKEGVDILLNLLENGNFSLSVKTPVPFAYGEYSNHSFKIGSEGKGLSHYAENDLSTISSGHEGQGQPDVYKGTIGKYRITMKLKAEAASLANPDIFPVTGEYWYGTGSNGKMTLKGTLTYKTDGTGVYRLDEYDPKGKKCGSFVLNEKTDVKTYVTTITGKMTNAKGTSHNVSLKRN